MALPEDLFFATIPELGAKLRAREISSKDLTRGVLDRLERFGPRYNALALLTRKQAMDRAADADWDFKVQRVRSPLQGVPYGAKDLLSWAGLPTTWGAKPYATQVFDYTATVLRKLHSARAPLAAKLAMVELAGGGGYRFASASMFGPGVNPWNAERWSGGSSSGSASAVAAGLVPFALGSETWGSILTPCAYCGVTGLRPTYGLVSRYGAMPLAWTMDKIGPICRSAEDCGLVLDEISGGDSLDPGSAGKRFFNASSRYALGIKTWRVGFSPVDFEEWAAPSARPAFLAALAVIRETGATLTETALPGFPYSQLAATIIAAEGSSVFEPLIESGQVDSLADQRQIAGLRAGLEVPAKDYLRAMRVRRLVQEELYKLLAQFDVLVAPARLGPATKISEPLDRSSAPQPRPAQPGLAALSAAGNLAGLPALVLPCGFAEGLPVAIQLVSRPFNEYKLLAMGMEFQKRTDWHRRRPPM
jgi:aspartyl-tRNA(Asn)/glutamyl-tRNA(Gln) amidotransferase subunit A